MATRLLNLALIPAFLIGYMEWGGGNSGFVYDAALAVFTGPGSFWQNLVHPIIAAALIGLILVVIRAARPTSSRWLIRAAVLVLAPMPILIFGIGAASANWPMVGSTLPFFVLAVIAWRRG